MIDFGGLWRGFKSISKQIKTKEKKPSLTFPRQHQAKKAARRARIAKLPRTMPMIAPIASNPHRLPRRGLGQSAGGET